MPACAASGAGRRRRPGAEARTAATEDAKDTTMSNLWDIATLKVESGVVVPGDTIPAVFWTAVVQRDERVWMREKKLGIWRPWTWRQTGSAVREIAHGLMALGFEPGERASILSNTLVEWVLADLAVLSAGGVSNGIYPTDAASQVHYLCEDSASVILFVEDDEQLDKALEVRERLPRLRRIVVFDMEGLHSLRARRRARGALAGDRSRVAGDPGLHLRHHRQAQGRDAQPPHAGHCHARLPADHGAIRE
jgi:long-chain acyl-CoA synthetase